ncbi:MAG: DUF4271 domain-containing protein [Bacteroidales bacterium]|nr:DUF4271 domain-containing protein [Bacteroidales bacterium]
MQADSVLKTYRNSQFEFPLSKGDSLFMSNDTVILSSGIPVNFITEINQHKSLEFEPRMNFQNDWIHFVFFVCLVILTLTKYLFHKDFVKTGKSFFSMRETYKRERESRLFKEPSVLLMGLGYLLSCSVFCFLIFKNLTGIQQDSVSEFVIFVYVLTVVGVGWLIKSSVIWFVGNVFQLGSASYFHRINNLLFNLNGGLFFLVASILIHYASVDYLPIVAGMIAGIAYIYRTFRNFLIGIYQSGFPYIYIILYICALEIAPVFVGVKMLQIHFF